MGLKYLGVAVPGGTYTDYLLTTDIDSYTVFLTQGATYRLAVTSASEPLNIAIGSLAGGLTWTVYDGQWIDYWGATSGSYGIGITGRGPYTISDSITSYPSLPPPAASAPPPPSPPLPPAIADLTDTTSHQSSKPGLTAYDGPVGGLKSQYLYTGPDSINLSTLSEGAFLHSGSGDDALQVWSGNNVLDGSTGSNFLTGGTGNDTFFVDDRAPDSDIWSSIAGFHTGDNATVWGVTTSDFTLNWLDNQGAAGAQGLTGGFTAAGKPSANVTLAGYSISDISVRLTVTYGRTEDTGGVSGSVFMNIHGN